MGFFEIKIFSDLRRRLFFRRLNIQLGQGADDFHGLKTYGYDPLEKLERVGRVAHGFGGV